MSNYSRTEHIPFKTKNTKNRKLVNFTLAFMALSFIGIQSVSSQGKFDFSKNGEIHNQVIHLWNSYYRDHFASEIKKRLLQDGDVYVLYELQIGGLQSFVEMTRRCKDTQQIAGLVDLLRPVFSARSFTTKLPKPLK